MGSEETKELVERHSAELESLRLQMEYRWRIIKFLLISVTSFGVFSTLTLITGISYEYTSNRGDKFAYHFPAEEMVKLLSVPVVATIATTIASVLAKDKHD